MLLKASLSHFVALRDRAVANLNVYLASPAGIGEHSDIVKEVVNMVEELDRANSCIDLLNGLMEQNNTQGEQGNE
tara:strand:+ start:468 stop:692 length:225 start_codon:yes stop_codon:yes gene_type:complete